MLDSVMNLDFTKPRPKAKEMSEEMGIDLTDEVVINEFKKMQKERLKEVKDMKEGKKREIRPKEVETEDYNDVFRESNRAVIEEMNEERKEEVQQDLSGDDQGRLTREIPESRKMDKEESGYSTGMIIGVAIV
mmetsp:Transcript_12625/g.11169  ORF Transcript_12625/g.11169 Transcript_12625/m.11169 type:complete len:133 (-) Transcript_12625:30-428(-)